MSIRKARIKRITDSLSRGDGLANLRHKCSRQNTISTAVVLKEINKLHAMMREHAADVEQLGETLS